MALRGFPEFLASEFIDVQQNLNARPVLLARGAFTSVRTVLFKFSFGCSWGRRWCDDGSNFYK